MVSAEPRARRVWGMWLLWMFPIRMHVGKAQAAGEGLERHWGLLAVLRFFNWTCLSASQGRDMECQEGPRSRLTIPSRPRCSDINVTREGCSAPPSGMGPGIGLPVIHRDEPRVAHSTSLSAFPECSLCLWSHCHRFLPIEHISLQ